MLYLGVKFFHVSCVVLSGALFALRGVWMLNGSPLLRERLVRVVPHVIDTCLLLSAGVLCVLTHQFPFVNTWLTLKLVLLIGYIVLGMYALHWGKTRAARGVYWRTALAVFALICLVAFLKPSALVI